MATVYLAHDRRHGRQVALKVLRLELSGVIGGDRFAREIAIAARLSHSRALPLYDSGAVATGTGPPVPFYTMPYVAGRSLRQRLEDESQLPIEEAVEIARQVADALDYAHRQGVVHRDIKPENILLAEGGALVADFGIARALDAAGGERLTETGLALGTPAYMSPEQAAGSSRLDGRADIYALGCVLYEMLAGQPPFTGPTTQAVVARHAMDPVPSLRTVRATVSPRLGRVVERALAKVPADRYPTARAFREALAAPDITGTQTVTALTPLRASARRLVPIGLGLALLLAVGAVVAVKARSSTAAPPALDPTLVAVAPFRVSSGDPSLGYLREGMVDLLAAKLSGTIALRPADARAMQRTWQSAADKGGDVSEQEALRLAAGLGAGRLVEGEVVSSGRRLTISAVLADVPGGRVRGRAAIEGAADSLTSLLDQIAARLLALGAGEPEQRLPSLAAASLPALRAYIDGRVLLRRNDYAGAIKRFETALAVDSGFALAALGLVRAGLETVSDRLGPGARAAWRLRDRLSPADRAQLEVLLGDRYPRESHVREHIQAAERFTQLAPDDPEAWNLYGVNLCCVGVLLGLADARERAKAAFGRALALDSSFTLAANAFTGMAAVLGDTVDMKLGLRLVMTADSTSPSSTALQWHVATVLGDIAAARRLARADSMISTRADGWAQTGPWAVMNVFLQEGVGDEDLDLIFKRSLEAAPTDDQRWSLLDLRYRLAIMRGRSTGLSLPPRWGGEGAEILRVMDALFSDADPAPAVPAAAALELAVGRPPDNCCLGRLAAAQYALQGGRLAIARRAAGDIKEVRATGPDAAALDTAFRAYALLIDAQIAAREGSPSAAGKLGQLDSMLTDLPGGWEKIPLYGNLIAARLHEQRKEYGPALDAIRRRDWTRNASEHVTYHREEGRIAAEAGDTAGAIRAYRRYLGIRAHAEPRLQPEVQRVRAALAALERPPAAR